MKYRFYWNHARRLMTRKQYPEALHWLRVGLEENPPKEIRRKFLYYSAVIMLKKGKKDSASQILRNLTLLDKCGPHRRYWERISNGYGQARMPDEDWNAFYSIQMGKYLAEKNRHIIRSAPEKDMVTDLIGDEWRRLCRAAELCRMSAEEKKKLFRRVKIYFPHLFIPQEEAEVLYMNFKAKKKIMPEDNCLCGSGLPFYLCCGRLPTVSEQCAVHN